MGLPVNNLQQVIHDLFTHTFNAQVVSVELSAESQMVFVPSMGFNQFSNNVNYGTEYTVIVTAHEMDSKFIKQDYPAHSIMYYVRYGFFEEALKGRGVLQNIRVDMDASKGGCRSTLQFVTNDLGAFSTALRDIDWKLYSKAFDQQVDEALSDNK